MVILLGLISSLITCFQPNVAMLNVLDFIIRLNMIQVCFLAWI